MCSAPARGGRHNSLCDSPTNGLRRSNSGLLRRAERRPICYLLSMKQQLLIVAICVMLLICSALTGPPTATSIASGERPTVNVPVQLRQANWLGPHREGCCTFASLCTALNWCGQYRDAQNIRQHYGDGQSPDSLARNMAKANLRFAWTVGDNNVAFLEQALAGRRAVMVAIDADPTTSELHMVDLVHLDSRNACLIDNNRPSEYVWVSRDAFLRNWEFSGSWAVVPLVGAPAPPLSNL
jgi:hypothetical protein